MYYNETKVGSQYSTCGTERARSLSEDDTKVYVAALNQAQFDPYTVNGIPSSNPICNKKAVVKGPNGQITVRFVDRCFDCKEGTCRLESLGSFADNFSSLGDIALTQEAFVAVAGELGNGHTNVEWHFI